MLARPSLRKPPQISPQNLFAVLAVLFGLVFVFLTPPFQGADEVEHFSRVYQITRHEIVPGELTSDLPASIVKAETDLKGNIPGYLRHKANLALEGKLLSQHLSPKDTVQATVVAASYSPAPYLPQIVVVYLLRHLNISPEVLLYVARLTALAAWVALIWLAIKELPIGKWALFVVALSPMAVYDSATVTADTMTTAYAFLLVALIFKMAFLPRLSQPWPNYTFILLLSVLLALSKSAYILIPLLVLVIPRANMSNLKKAVVITSTLLAGLTWAQLTGHLNEAAVRLRYPLVMASPTAQMKDLIAHPLHGVFVEVNTILTSNSNGFVMSLPGFLGWADTPIPAWVTIWFYVLLVLALLYHDGPLKLALGRTLRLWSAIIFVGTSALVVLALYLTFTPTGSSYAQGLQGRYFLPALVLLIPLTRMKLISLQADARAMKYLAVTSSSCLLLISAAVLAARFYTL